MEIIRHIKVDLYGDTQHFAVAAKQMDMGTRYIGVTLMEDGVMWGTPLIVGGLILYDTIQEKNPELCGFTAEEFDKEENK